MINTKYSTILFILILSCFFFSCKDYTPKPKGYPRIEKGEDSTFIYSNDIFSFAHSSSATIENLVADKKNERWLNIHYPQYKATIYCSYISISKEQLRAALEDNHRIVYSHAAQAAEIKQTFLSNTDHSSGILYNITGDVASPVQFFLTDSTSHFFRGSLYYDNKTDPDSVAPITSFLRQDIIQIASSIRWNDSLKNQSEYYLYKKSK